MDSEIPNQVFIGCPWLKLRPKYEGIIAKLKKKFPLSFVIVGRDDDQDAAELLTIIKGKLEASSRAIFDATGGNANVSLEYGFAEAKEIPRSIYMYVRAADSRKRSGDRPIISDLAGKKQNHYKQVAGLLRLLTTMSRTHNYTVRFEKFLAKGSRRKSAGQKKHRRALALKVIHQLDGKEKVRREDLVQALLGGGYRRAEVDVMIRSLHVAGLVASEQGRYSSVTIA